ncbi:Copia protein, partial [Mucuna pruriens]
MPFASLENQIPHSILFPKDKMHHVPPRVFDCVVINFLQEQSNVCFLDILIFKRGTNVTLYPQKDTICQLMLQSLRKPCSSPPKMILTIQQPLPIPYLSSTESSSFETHNQDILQPSYFIHSQAELSLPSMSTYQSRTQEMDPLDSCPLSSTDPTPDPPSSSPSHDSKPIALWKGIRSTRNPHPIYLSYHLYLLPLDHLGWRQAMALEQSGTWKLVSVPLGKKVVGCRWVFAIKVGPNGTVDRLKVRLVYGLDYGDTFSPVAKITTIRLLLAIVAICDWPLHQLDIKNAFLHGDLHEEIYMEQPLGFYASFVDPCMDLNSPQELGLESVVQNFRMTRSEAYHFVFYCHSSFDKCVYLVVYVDEIVITGNDDIKISYHFQTKDLGHLKYFLGIEVAQSKEDINKYALDILQETSTSNYGLVDSPMDPNMKLMVNEDEPYFDPKRYRRLVRKLIYLTIIRPDISFVVGVVAVIRILRYIKKTPGHGLLYEDKGDTHISGFCISIGGNVVSWKSKKQNTVARSSAEAECRAIASATCELIWVKQLIQELKFADVQPIKMYCDNQVVLHIASNPVFHERTKHIEIDCHFVQEKLLAKEISTEFVNSSNQLVVILTKSLRGPQIQ